MSKLIAAATVIRGYGECQAYINDVAQEEIQRQQERMRRDFEWRTKFATVAEEHRDRILAEQCAELNRKLNKRPTPMQRVKRRIENAWAMLWAMFICYSEALGLIERDDE